MREAIVLYQGEFGRLELRNVVGDLVTHVHRDVHVIVWLQGAVGEMMVGGRTVAPSRNVAIGVNSFELHNHNMMANGPGGIFLAFYLDPDWAHQRRGIDHNMAHFARPTISLDPSMHQLAMDLVARLTEGDGANHLHLYEIVSFIDRVLDAAEADRQSERSREPARVRTTRDFRIRKAIDLMKAKVSTRVCFDEVARAAGLSRPHFFALFKEQMNVTPNIFWNMLRMEEALRQIHESEDSLTEIAIDLGFTTQGNFSRFFREHTGVPPAVYRSAARQSSRHDDRRRASAQSDAAISRPR